MAIIVSQQSTFRRYAATVLSPFFSFAVFDVSLVITPLTSVINYVFFCFGAYYSMLTTNTTLKLIDKNAGTVGGPLTSGGPRHETQQPPHRYATDVES